MSEFKRIPGFESKYAIDMNGRVYNLKNKSFVKICFAFDSGGGGEPKHKKCLIDGKYMLIPKLMVMTFMGADTKKHAYFEYIDKDMNNTSIHNIRYSYIKSFKGGVAKSYVDYLSKIQKESLCTEVTE